VHPSLEQLARLDPFERLAFHLVDYVNTNPVTKAGSSAFLRTVGRTWVYFATRHLIHIHGLDNVRRLEPERGLLLASNHRSFFDQYVISAWLFRTCDLLRRVYFPVKADFFYQRPLGVAVSLIMSALSMYPPMFREDSKREFNTYGLRRLIQILQEPGSVVGLHPEGTRGKGLDPHTMLPAQPGIGKLIIEARPVVLPIFINGLGNELPRQIWSNFDRTGTPIIIVFGEPLDLSSFYAKRNTLRTQKALADFVREAILALGDREREYRRSLEAHPVPGPVLE
jgi:1-acyl-sn-glycerol-3-phosphate acyltransferase